MSFDASERWNDRLGGYPTVIVLLVLGLLTVPATATAQPETLSVTAADGTLSLEAINSSLDHVLVKVGETIHARVVIETILATELAQTRVDTSFPRMPVTAAVRRLLAGRHYVVLYGPAGVDELRIYADGTTGYRELTASDPLAKSRPTSMPLTAWPPDDPAEVAPLRQAVLDGRDASARVEALDELSNIRDEKLLMETFVQVLARERDGRVLQRLFGLAAQQPASIPSEALRTVVGSDLDGAPRALAVELLADRAGDDPSTRALLRSLAATDASPEVRDAAVTALGILEGPAARSASELPIDRTRVKLPAANHND